MSVTATGAHDERIGTRPHRLPARLLRLASDERLVELMRDGSDAAFEALFARHLRGVLSFCRHMLGSADEAEDAVQHTFLAAYADLVGSRKQIQLRPWLYAIARNRCLSVLRARRERVEAQVEPETENLSADVERRWELRALLGDLAGLPDDQRAALVLAELGDLSHDEIGAALGCPREKVKALVFQARSSLIASREARDTSCEVIREQLANLRGSALRRNLLRRHLRDCAGCREFRDNVQAQRRDLALILPVAPSFGLQAAVLGGGAAATGSVVAKTAVVLALVGGGAVAVETTREDDRPATPTASRTAVGGVAADESRAKPAAVVGTLPATTVGPSTARGAKPETARGPKRSKAERQKARRKATPPGQAKKPAGFAPPGQAKRSGDFVPPGQTKKSGGEFAPPGQAKATGEFVAPGQTMKSVPKPETVTPPKVMPEKAAPPAVVEKPGKDAAPGQTNKQ